MRRSWEAQVGPGGFDSFVVRAAVGGELTDALFEGGVLRGDPLNRILGPFGLQVAAPAKEFANAGALGADLGVRALSASSALRAHSRQVASREFSVSASSLLRWMAVSRIALATAVFASAWCRGRSWTRLRGGPRQQRSRVSFPGAAV